jgi:hypothetical protein
VGAAGGNTPLSNFVAFSNSLFTAHLSFEKKYRGGNKRGRKLKPLCRLFYLVGPA